MCIPPYADSAIAPYPRRAVTYAMKRRSIKPKKATISAGIRAIQSPKRAYNVILSTGFGRGESRTPTSFNPSRPTIRP